MSLSINDVFDANFYRAHYSDLSGLNDAQALSHFQAYGLNEGRSFSPLIDLSFYRASNSDLKNLNNSDLLNHLENYGVAEGRSFSPVVDLTYYQDLYSDLKSFNNEQLFNHLKNNGVNEGRYFDPLFSFGGYKSLNSDLTNLNNSQLLNHFEINGIKEGRESSPYFDFNYYRANNKDLANLDNNQLLQHFVINGINEGRKSSPFFDAGYYKANNPDLASLKGINLLDHLDLHGIFEGRQAASEYAGNTLNTAPQLTIGSNYNLVLGHVGSSEPNDYYQFTLNQASTVSIYDYGYFRSVGEQILDSNGQVVNSTNSAVSNPGGNSVTGNAGQSVSLNPGTYYIRIQPQAGNTDYEFFINATTPQNQPQSTNTSSYLGDWVNSAYGLSGDQLEIFSNGSYQMIKENSQGGVQDDKGLYLPGSDDVTTGNFTVNGSTILFHPKILQVYGIANSLGNVSSTNYPNNTDNDSSGTLQGNILAVKDSQENVVDYVREIGNVLRFSNPLSS